MKKIGLKAGLALAAEHMAALSPAALYRRPMDTDGSTFTAQWDFPTAGSIHVTFGFDVEYRGAAGVAMLVPVVRISSSVSGKSAAVLTAALCLGDIVTAALGVEALMQSYTYDSELP